MGKIHEKKHISRRDFLKLGGFTAITLPAVFETTPLAHTLYESQEEYGGFLIRKKTGGASAYRIDDSVYQRFDAKNSALGRSIWDDEVIQQVDNLQKTDSEIIATNEPGYRKEDFALLRASWITDNLLNSGAAMHGLHKSLFQVHRLNSGTTDSEFYDVPWERDHLTKEGITQKVKKAAKFFGASLVGIAELDERWIYGKSFDTANPEESGEIIFTEADQLEIPTPEECKQSILTELQEMKDDQLKDFLITTLEEIDSEALPPGSPSPFLVDTLPPNQVAQMVPMMMDIMPEIVLDAIARKLDLPFCTSNIDPSVFTSPRYLEDGITLGIPRTMKWVIALAFELDIDALASSPGATSAASIGNGYSRITTTVGNLAEFIRMLGFNAIPCSDMTGLSIPMAIDAGLGELGRNGMLVTPKYGPRVQLAKVITDMPLLPDQAIHFGVTEFCQICNRCAQQCPGQAISFDAPSSEAIDLSNNPGVEKWAVNAVYCLTASSALGSSICSTCIQVCPFNKPEGWLHDVTRRLIEAKNSSIDKLILSADENEKDATQDDFWESDNFIHIKD